MALAVPEQQPETFKGLPFDGIAVPAGFISTGAAGDAAAAWSLFERTLPPGMKGLLTDAPQDPFDNRHLSRRDAVAILANTFRDRAAEATAKVLNGQIDAGKWSTTAMSSFRLGSLVAASVQGGGTHVLDSPMLQRRLAAVQANAELRMNSLQERLLLGPDHPDGISLAQANAWGAQAMRGLVRTAGQMGAAESLGDRPVRRGMTAFEAHCLTCPSKAGLYTNIRECIEKCGGWVGDGSDQCHGNCLCYVRPASITSVYGDDLSGSLKVRLANLPPVEPAGGAAVIELPVPSTALKPSAPGAAGSDGGEQEPSGSSLPATATAAFAALAAIDDRMEQLLGDLESATTPDQRSEARQGLNAAYVEQLAAEEAAAEVQRGLYIASDRSLTAPRFNSVDEAEAWARTYAVLRADYTGLTVDAANKLNAGLAEALSQHPEQIGRLRGVSAIDMGGEDYGQYWFEEQLDLDKLKRRTVEIDIANANKGARARQLLPNRIKTPGTPARQFISTSTRSTILHEFAHHLDDTSGDALQAEVKAARAAMTPAERRKYDEGLSKYGVNGDPAERLAESWALWRIDAEAVPPPIREIFERHARESQGKV